MNAAAIGLLVWGVSATVVILVLVFFVGRGRIRNSYGYVDEVPFFLAGVWPVVIAVLVLAAPFWLVHRLGERSRKQKAKGGPLKRETP